LCQASDPEWLELRRTGITASDLPVILGLVSWDSPWALYHRKRGLLPEVEQTDRMRLGSWLEDMIAGYWADNYGYEVQPGNLFASVERPWQMATPDRVVLTPAWAPDGVLECKTSATRDGWGGPGTADVPAHVRAQVLWQMDTLGVGVGHVAVCFLPSGEFRSYTIEHDTQTGESHQLDIDGRCLACRDQYAMRQAGLEFYRRITGDLPAPPVDALTVTTRALQQVYAGLNDTQTAELDPGVYGAWDEAKAALKEAETDVAEYQNAIREAMGTAGTATVDGRPVLRRQVSKRAGYEVAPGVVDKLVRIKQEDADPDEQVRNKLRDLRDER
jgi:putative phage-type endonuclease